MRGGGRLVKAFVVKKPRCAVCTIGGHQKPEDCDASHVNSLQMIPIAVKVQCHATGFQLSLILSVLTAKMNDVWGRVNVYHACRGVAKSLATPQ
jgi:uncharacterized protein (DUF983 family)